MTNRTFLLSRDGFEFWYERETLSHGDRIFSVYLSEDDNDCIAECDSLDQARDFISDWLKEQQANR